MFILCILYASQHSFCLFVVTNLSQNCLVERNFDQVAKTYIPEGDHKKQFTGKRNLDFKGKSLFHIS